MPVARPEPRYDVFISYRRGAADELALLLQTQLQKHGVTAFLDRDLRRGVFDDMLLRCIAESPSFLIILTPNALDHCADEEDWLRKEIVQAISKKRNIIPLQVDSFQFTQEVLRKLDPSVRELARYQAVEYSRAYFEHTVERIVKIVEEDKEERKIAQEAEASEAEKKRIAAKRPQGEKEETEDLLSKYDLQKKRNREALERYRQEMAERKESRAATLRRLRKPLWAIAVIVMVVLLITGGLKFFTFLGFAHSSQQPKADANSKKAAAKPNSLPTSTPAGTVKINPKDGLNYVWIPSGTFQMGCSAGDDECYPDEKPMHSVTISKGFWFGQTLVIQGAYQRVMSANPSHFRGDKLPVESLTWTQAKAYCEMVAGRLPSEAEWEYAARAGSSVRRYGELQTISWYGKNSGHKTHDVAQKQPNPWRLYDMLGNVYEWMGDWLDYRYYTKSPIVDPTGPGEGQERVVRGGSWLNASMLLRVSYRGTGVPEDRYDNVGFRCALEVLP